MRHDEIGVVDVHVDAERCEEQAGQAADREQTDEAEGVQHRRVVGDRSLVQRRGPVEDLDGRRNRDEIAQKRKDHAGVNRLPMTNMWCPQTRKPSTAMAMLEEATKPYPKIRLREKQVISSLTTPMPGRIMM